MARAVDESVFNATAELVNDFKHYFTAAGQPVSENPSPGNQAGGITTLEEKSLGAVQKAGDAPLTQVLRYGERVRKPRLGAARSPRQRRGIQHRPRGRRRHRAAVHHRARHAAGFSGTDAEDLHQQRARAGEAALDRFRRRAVARRREHGRARRRTCSSW